MPVPLLDLKRQYHSIKNDIDSAVTRVFEHSRFILGPEVADFEEAVAHKLGVAHAVGVASGTDALILGLHAVGVGPGDEVVVPDFSFFSTASAATRLGAKPVFCDIRSDDYNIDPGLIEAKITSKTKAIMPVHLFGQMPDMERIGEIAATRGIPLVEDAAQAIGATYKDKPAGRWGQAGCFSFFPTKNLGAPGDGGMIVSDDTDTAERVRILRVHGAKPKYHHHTVGYNSRLDALHAAVLNVKLAHLDGWTEARRAHADIYDRELAGVGDLVLPKRTPGAYHIYNQYTIATAKRDALRDYLKERQIGMEIYYPIPLHLQKCFADLGGKPGDLPATERASESVLSLPIFAEMTEAEQSEVIDTIKSFFA
jgi:dTDP-4-amino-4,6-dideoxygalactose transaminase